MSFFVCMRVCMKMLLFRSCDCDSHTNIRSFSFSLWSYEHENSFEFRRPQMNDTHTCTQNTEWYPSMMLNQLINIKTTVRTMSVCVRVCVCGQVVNGKIKVCDDFMHLYAERHIQRSENRMFEYCVENVTWKAKPSSWPVPFHPMTVFYVIDLILGPLLSFVRLAWKRC